MKSAICSVATALSCLAVSCGPPLNSASGSSTGIQEGASGQSSRTLNQPWSRVTRTTVCKPPDAGSFCRSGTLSVSSDSSFTLSSENTPAARGALSPQEFQPLNATLQAINAQDLSSPPQCENVVSIPEIASNLIQMERADGTAETLLELNSRSGTRCFRGDKALVEQLDQQLRELFNLHLTQSR